MHSLNNWTNFNFTIKTTHQMSAHFIQNHFKILNNKKKSHFQFSTQPTTKVSIIIHLQNTSISLAVFEQQQKNTVRNKISWFPVYLCFAFIFVFFCCVNFPNLFKDFQQTMNKKKKKSSFEIQAIPKRNKKQNIEKQK